MFVYAKVRNVFGFQQDVRVHPASIFRTYKPDQLLGIIYTPTCVSSEEELENFYDDLDKGMRQCRLQEINLVMGDLNAKVGKGQYQDIVGPYGLGTRNDTGLKGDR